jgi:hypothetical protein
MRNTPSRGVGSFRKLRRWYRKLPAAAAPLPVVVSERNLHRRYRNIQEIWLRMLIFENARVLIFSKKSICSPNRGTYRSGRGRLGKRNLPRFRRCQLERVLKEKKIFFLSKNFLYPGIQKFRDFQGLQRKKFIAAERMVVRPRTRYR